MKKHRKNSCIQLLMLFSLLFATSCKDFYNPDQLIEITEDNLYKDWYEYRSVAMGIYGLQQNLVEQIVILGELRGDLLTITENADADLVEISNFNISKENAYASPENFFKLINACNNFIRVIESRHPEVLDKSAEVTNYDRLYGEILCMRAWAYFNAARIYGKVPFIPTSLATMEEVTEYVNSPGTYVDSITIVFDLDGFHNDTIYADSVYTMEKKFYTLPIVIEHLTDELENKVKALEVDYTANNPSERTWQITTWNTYAWHALLGIMYLTEGDLLNAAYHYEQIINNPSDEEYRYQLTDDFGGSNWRTIFHQLDNKEHILSIYFDKDMQQQHSLNYLFIPVPPYKFMLKPTKIAVNKYEASWMGYTLLVNNSNPALTRVDPNNIGFPGDPRGYGMTFLYLNIGNLSNVNVQEYIDMIYNKALGNTRDVNALMESMDTIVFKYYNNQYEDDMCFPIYRAGSIHLYLSEIFNYWVHWVPSSTGGAPTLRTELNKAMGLVNYGEYYSVILSRIQRGVRGRVGYQGTNEAFSYSNVQYNFDPETNKVIGYVNLGTNTLRKQLRFEDNLLDERARECMFEGERFYDLMRIAKRRNDPSYLATRVAAKYPAGKREQIYNLLLDENNWYINMFD